MNEEAVSIARLHWARAGVANKIEAIIAPALTTLAALESGASARFDLAFIDADKPVYDHYYECAHRLVRPGGLIVLDNMLRRGEVADPTCEDPRTLSIRALNAKIAMDERVDRVMLPVADGMTLVHRRA